MKGVIAECMARLVTDKKGKSVWEAVLREAGLDANDTFLPTDDVPDEQVVRLADATARVLGMTREQTAEAFGEYWINQYAPKIYRIYFSRFESSREFLEGMDDLHDKVTRNVPNARPPRFEYEEVDEKTLIMTYKSSRNMLEFFVGLVRGVGRHFGEDLKIFKLGGDRVKVVFP